MQDSELQQLWKAYDTRLEESRILNLQSWALNLQCFETLQTFKAKSKLDSLAVFKAWAAILGIVWVLFLAILVYGNRFANPYFSISVSMILLFSLFATILYIKHFILIKRINYSGSVTATQKKLAALEASTFSSTRIVWLQLPFHTTWFWSSEWILADGLKFWLVSGLITLLFTGLAIFLYRNINVDNLHKKWLRILMMAGPEYTSVVKARDFMDEIEDFKKELGKSA